MNLTDNEIRQNIKNALIECRKEKGLTQEQLADILGSKPTTVASWEQGKSLPNIQTLYSLAVFYKKTIGHMYGDPAGPDLRNDERVLLELYNALNDRGQDHVRTAARSAGMLPEFKKDTTYAPAKTG